MKYKVILSNRQPSKGKYVARAVHDSTIETLQVEEEIEHNCSATKADVVLVITELVDVMKEHLQRGERVHIAGLGTFKLELRCSPKDTAEAFSNDDIKAVAVHFLPECKHGKPLLYQGIKLERVYERHKAPRREISPSAPYSPRSCNGEASLTPHRCEAARYRDG